MNMGKNINSVHLQVKALVLKRCSEEREHFTGNSSLCFHWPRPLVGRILSWAPWEFTSLLPWNFPVALNGTWTAPLTGWMRSTPVTSVSNPGVCTISHKAWAVRVSLPLKRANGKPNEWEWYSRPLNVPCLKGWLVESCILVLGVHSYLGLGAADHAQWGLRWWRGWLSASVECSYMQSAIPHIIHRYYEGLNMAGVCLPRIHVLRFNTHLGVLRG